MYMPQTKFRAKKLNQQTLVITGAPNEIEISTALKAGEKGANVVLAARFDTNFWGARMGCHLPALAMKENGGVIINLGSEISVSSQPLREITSASKHALKVFTESFRVELRHEGIPVEVCLIRPSGRETSHPDVTATSILKCAEFPQRDVYVGGPARLSSILDTFFPKVIDMITEVRFKELKKEKTETSTLGAIQALKDNFKPSFKEGRKEDGH
jgi:short-subunit dehydrogenase